MMKRHADEKIHGVEEDARRCENIDLVIAMMIAENIQAKEEVIVQTPTNNLPFRNIS
jgi:hypothetical protein